MMKKICTSLLTAALVPVAAVVVGAAGPAAIAQPKNPCAPVLLNPCASVVAKPVNPCAPAAAAPAKPADAVALPSAPYDTTTKATQAAYGDKMPGIVENYLRATPYIGTGGVINPAGMSILSGLGFKTIINLNTAEEGATAEKALVEAAGMTYINVPVPIQGADARADQGSRRAP
ncbi:hypothetical protein [Breoghania sp.]|uniref:hypothetical protein n=1 Tax=Breoghania sp. TaxID=2065378 RepID=UPI00260E2FE6|nr:hypothetical protein [Breoghania sp.]MDJ0932057.1 hypothetical protein [Breoghania sp.]